MHAFLSKKLNFQHNNIVANFSHFKLKRRKLIEFHFIAQIALVPRPGIKKKCFNFKIIHSRTHTPSKWTIKCVSIFSVNFAYKHWFNWHLCDVFNTSISLRFLSFGEASVACVLNGIINDYCYFHAKKFSQQFSWKQTTTPSCKQYKRIKFSNSSSFTIFFCVCASINLLNVWGIEFPATEQAESIETI